jgi:hypothetical protein
LTGEIATPESSGYILEPYTSLEIKGFRESLDTVGRFKFVDSHKSYAGNQGKGGNEGVIGIRIFEEKAKPIIWNQTITTSNPVINWGTTNWLTGCGTYNMAAGASYTANTYDDGHTNCCLNTVRSIDREVVDKKTFDVGTSWGERITDKVVEAEFERGLLIKSIDIYYATRNALEELGVRTRPEKKVVKYPKSFTGFCKPPANW